MTDKIKDGIKKTSDYGKWAAIIAICTFGYNAYKDVTNKLDMILIIKEDVIKDESTNKIIHDDFDRRLSSIESCHMSQSNRVR